MTIASIQNGYFQTQAVGNMQTQLSNLETELSTGEVSQNYAGIGNDRGLAIALQSQLSSINNYGSVINSVGVRLTSAQNALGAIQSSSTLVQSATLNSQYTLNQNGQTTDQQTASGQLTQVIDALNTQVGNDYIFSGSATNTPSVASVDEMLNGNGAQAGLNQLISERAQADLGTNGLGRLVIPPPSGSPAAVVGSGATLSPDAIASVAGAQDISALSSGGGTLIINGQPVTINAGDNATATLADINGESATTGVTASLDSGNHLVLQSQNAATAVAIGGGSSASVLTELGLSAATTNPTNLITQGAVANPQTLTIAVGSNPPLTITFGTGAGQVSTLQGLDTALAGLAGATASVDPATGNVSITALNNTDSITVGGTANVGEFGLAAGTTAPTAGTSVALSEDVAGSPFGLKIASVSSTLTGASVTGPTGSPPAVTVDLATNPNPGDTLTYTFNLPDGTTQQMTLTATTASPPAAGQFTIGATPAATATNLQSALTSSVSTVASTSLTVASAFAAANDFFNADAADPPQRVDGPPFATATSLVAGTSANTVTWYTGDASSTPARDTATAQIDPSVTVSYGMRANESALRTTVENLAVFSAMTFSASDPNGSARYAALTQRVSANLDIPAGSQSVTDIEADIASAQTAMQTATTNHTQTTATLQDMVQNITGANTDNVGAEILDLQTRLQASLQVTALLAHTNLATLLSSLG
jgi:flagellar hook-associated protein 3 FlgL